MGVKDYLAELEMVATAVAKFPDFFALRSFPNRIFRVHPQKSYYSHSCGVQLIVQVLENGENWLDFTRTGPYDLSVNMVAI